MFLVKKITGYGPVLLILAITLFGLIDLVLPIDFRTYGLRPRSLDGLIGVVTMPFIHGSIGHFISNVGPLLVLAFFVWLSRPEKFYPVTALLIVISGLLTWVIASNGYVVGASGLVFGYWSFLIATAVFNRNIRSFLFAALTIFVYGYLIFAFIEVKAGVSYAGHFSGLLSGVIVASFKPFRQSKS